MTRGSELVMTRRGGAAWFVGIGSAAAGRIERDAVAYRSAASARRAALALAKRSGLLIEPAVLPPADD